VYFGHPLTSPPLYPVVDTAAAFQTLVISGAAAIYDGLPNDGAVSTFKAGTPGMTSANYFSIYVSSSPCQIDFSPVRRPVTMLEHQMWSTLFAGTYNSGDVTVYGYV